MYNKPVVGLFKAAFKTIAFSYYVSATIKNTTSFAYDSAVKSISNILKVYKSDKELKTRCSTSDPESRTNKNHIHLKNENKHTRLTDNSHSHCNSLRKQTRFLKLSLSLSILDRFKACKGWCCSN